MTLIPVADHETQRAWSLFPKSLIQAVLHNELLQMIECDRGELEKCRPDEVAAIQERIKARRQLLGFLHRHDNK